MSVSRQVSPDWSVGPLLYLDVGVHLAVLVAGVAGGILRGCAAWQAGAGDQLLEIVQLVDAVGVVGVGAGGPAVRQTP